MTHPIVKAAQRKGFYIKASSGDPKDFLNDILRTAQNGSPFTMNQLDQMVAGLLPSIPKAVEWIQRIDVNIEMFAPEQAQYAAEFYQLMGELSDEDRASITGQPIAKRYCDRMQEKMLAIVDFVGDWKDTIQVFNGK